MPPRRPLVAALTRTSRTAASASLDAAGVTGPAKEELLRVTGRGRHGERVVQHVERALMQTMVDRGSDAVRVGDATPYECTGAIALLTLDAFGPYRRAEEPESPKRHRAFRGCGQRLGAPGAAFAAAAKDAALRLWRMAGGLERPSILFRALQGELLAVVVSEGDDRIEAVLHVEPCVASDAQPPGWMLTVAHEGLRRAAGVPPLYRVGAERTAADLQTGPNVLELVHRFEGDVETWSELVNAATSRRRFEHVLEAWHRVVRDLPPDRAQALPPLYRPRRTSWDEAWAWIHALELPEASRDALAAALAGEGTPSELEALFVHLLAEHAAAVEGAP